MVKIEVAKPINFNRLITSKEAEVVSMRILSELTVYFIKYMLYYIKLFQKSYYR